MHMQSNTLSIIIEKPLQEVYDFTTNPKNTPLRLPSIKEEQSSDYPPKIHTVYKNCGADSAWNTYHIIEILPYKTFVLSEVGWPYFVRYTYLALSPTSTKITYTERVEDGELTNPCEEELFIWLKGLLEHHQ